VGDGEQLREGVDLAYCPQMNECEINSQNRLEHNSHNVCILCRIESEISLSSEFASHSRDLSGQHSEEVINCMSVVWWMRF